MNGLLVSQNPTLSKWVVIPMSGMETHSWVYGIIPTVTSREYWECNLTHCHPKVGILTFFPVLAKLAILT